MKSATITLNVRLYSLLFLCFLALLLIFTTKAFAQTTPSQPDINDARCEAIYINGTGVPNGGTYPTSIKIGEKFHVEIKMKNTGQRDWRQDQYYRLGGADSNPVYFGILSRGELPNNDPITPNNSVVFAFDPAANPNGYVGTHPDTYRVIWQMLRESTAHDAGGWFGQKCDFSITFVKPDTTTPPANPPTTTVQSPKLSFPFQVNSQVSCDDNSKDTEKVGVVWRKNDGVGSVTTGLREAGGVTNTSGCLPATITSNVFQTIKPTVNNASIDLALYADNKCQQLVTTQNMPIVNGFAGGLVDGWKYTSVNFQFAGGAPIALPLTSCKALPLTLPTPNKLTDIPVSIQVVRSKYPGESGGTANETKTYTVKFRYQPSSDNNND